MQAAPVVIGVNPVGAESMTPAQQDVLIAHLRQNGVTTIRTGLGLKLRSLILRAQHSGIGSRQTVEHVFGTLKAWMGATHFKTRRLKNVASEMTLHVLAYNLKRAIALLGVRPLISALQA